MISIIIPVYNEGSNLGVLLGKIKSDIGYGVEYEIIVSDGGSEDDTVDIALKQNAKVISSAKGRANQMNAGAKKASGNILYFLHADTLPPVNFGQIIQNYYSNGFIGGCFRLKFDSFHWILKFSGWASRFNIRNFQFGDQSLFVEKKVFDETGGFNDKLLLMEDVEIVSRIKKHGPFAVMPYNVTTSSRKYIKHGIFKTEFAHFIVFCMYLLKFKQPQIAGVYKYFLKN